MGCSGRRALVLSFLALAPAVLAQPATRRPRGIYAGVNIQENLQKQQAANPPITPAQYFVNLYQDLVGYPAVSGLAIWVNWDALNPNQPPAANAYDWSFTDQAFIAVAAWNSQNPASPPKTIQLVPLPGFQTPSWVLDQIPSCDGLFQAPVQTPSSNCGKATFTGFVEGGGTRELPMPWNPAYKGFWQTFLSALAARYQSNPAFVSISVAGPTASSEEMILPDNANTPAQDAFGGILPNAMWIKLLTFHYPGMAPYQKSDQAFIDEWNNAIDLYGQIFSGVTLIATTGSGFPNLSTTGFPPVPFGFSADCPNPDMDCVSETTILSYFEKPTVGGANAKATQEDGMEAARVSMGQFNLGVDGVKLVSQSTAQLPAPSAQVLGGAQFNSSFSTFPLQEGCTSKFPPNASDPIASCSIPSNCTIQACIPVACIPQACIAPGFTQADLAKFQTYSQVTKFLIPPEQSAYNVLNQYFDETPVASSFGGSPGTVPLNYLQIYAADFQYAETNVNAPAQVVETSGATVSMSAQDLLNLASQKLLAISEPPLLPAIFSGGIVPVFSTTGIVAPGEWVSIYGRNLASGTSTWTGNFPTSLGGTSVTIDGTAAYLSFVSPGQIDLQVPNDAATGSVPVVVKTAAGSAASSVTLAAFSPSFCLLDAKHVAAIIPRSDGSGAYGGGSYDLLGPTGTSLGYGTVAAKAGDVVELFGTGFGPTNPAVPAGQPFAGAAQTTNPVTLRINNFSVTPTFAGLSGAGLYQINLIVPSGLGTGDVSLQAAVGGAQAPSGVVMSLQ